jgi:rhodanese-related sulfurtransferase
MKRIIHYFSIIFLFTSCFPTVKVAGQFTEQEFIDMASQMAKGPVKDVTVEEMKEKSTGTTILLDTRDRKEYGLSHLAGSRWVGFKDFDLATLSDLPKDATIVAYCSVGYRSERIGEKLQKAGFQNVANLKGGIFDWVNKGNAVVDGQGKAVEVVHGYNKKWGVWVKSGKVVF